MAYQLKKKYILNGQIMLQTGMHIGGTNTAMSIGTIDKTVIRNPVNQQPIIPGSSLKGKMRSLFELSSGEVNLSEKEGKGNVNDDKDSQTGSLFGVANAKKGNKPSRLIVRDAFLDIQQTNRLNQTEDFFKHVDLLYTEAKTEVGIDRITAKANPRQFERVPAGSTFRFRMVLNVFSDDNEEQLLKNTFSALKLLQDDYLGGNGSRGYGQIDIRIDSVKLRSSDYYLNGEAEQNADVSIPESLKTLQVEQVQPA